ncbi:MAG: aminotransferase class III-fold pyridoxal phosphate-dependent enzyme [Nitrososphaeria archaeon]
MNYVDRTLRSHKLFEKAKEYIPGGSAYAIRYFEPYPFYVSKTKGSKIWDVDGNEYVDFWLCHFGAIFGHCYKPVMAAVKEQLDFGAHLGWCNEWEVKWAEVVCKWFNAERVKPANSGTESNMYAIGLAKAFTGKHKVGKMEGGWHGGFNNLNRAVNYPYDKPAALNLPISDDLIPLPFNDLDGVIKRIGNEELACVIVEPVLGSAGFIPAEKEFLKGLREYCDRKNTLLIFDEVITGFKHPNGLQGYYGVKPDLTTMGKTVGGQYFAGAGGICGRADIMTLLDQTKRRNFWERSAHGGTFVGNALTMRAGYVTISELFKRKDEVYEHVNSLSSFAVRELNRAIEESKFEAYITGALSLFGLHFTKEKPVNGETAERTKDRELSRALFTFLLDKGVAYLTPNTPHFTVSFAHTQSDVERLVFGIEEFLANAKGINQ